MKRSECIAMLHPELDDKVVVTIMGACAQELYDLGHRENFFYLQHAMGLASSIGLGLALYLPREGRRPRRRRLGADEPRHARDVKTRPCGFARRPVCSCRVGSSDPTDLVPP